MNSFRAIANKMDSVRPVSSLRALIDMHRWAPSGSQTFGNIVARHSNRSLITRRFLSMNTYLMDTFHFQEKPAVADRARAFGEIILKNHDLALLQEVFEDNVKDIILKAWSSNDQPSVVEDAYTVTQGSSGLVSISQKEALKNKNFFEFNHEEGDDAWADKGVLFSTMDVGLGTSKLEIYNTHLNSAGSWARKLQLFELVSFVERKHNKNNVAILAGDFNLAPNDAISFKKSTIAKVQALMATATGAIFSGSINNHFVNDIEAKLNSNEFPNGMTEYRVITALLEKIGFTDLWRNRNGTSGYTSSADNKNTREKICKPAQDNPLLCDDLRVTGAGVGSRRLDYIFVSKPSDFHTFSLDFTRPRRVRYERAANAPLREDIKIMFNSQELTIKGIDMLSDHLGLSADLLFSPI